MIKVSSLARKKVISSSLSGFGMFPIFECRVFECPVFRCWLHKEIEFIWKLNVYSNQMSGIKIAFKLIDDLILFNQKVIYDQITGQNSL
jgi:hypothetical protein